MIKSSQIVKLTELKEKFSPKERAKVIFGGSFDPIHAGHISVIRRLKLFFDEVCLAPTAQNPWKAHSPMPLSDRIEMINMALNFEAIQAQVYTAGYTYVDEIVDSFKKPVFWAVGDDIKDSVFKWRSWDSMGLFVVPIPFEIDTSSTRARSGETAYHPAIKGYINSKGFYSD